MKTATTLLLATLMVGCGGPAPDPAATAARQARVIHDAAEIGWHLGQAGKSREELTAELNRYFPVASAPHTNAEARR